MLLAILLAASSFPVGALITHALPPEVLMFLRFLTAGLLFLPFVLRGQGGLPSRSALKAYLLLSLPLVVFFWCMFESLRYTSVVNTGALYTLVPAITALWERLVNGTPVGRLRGIGLSLGTLGALWIVFRGDLNNLLGLRLNYGDLIFLCGAVCLGLYNPLVRRLHRGEPMIDMTFWILAFGALCLLLISVFHAPAIDWSGIGIEIYYGVLYLALFCTLMTFFIINFSTLRIGATQVAAYGFLTPLFVIVLGLVLGIESFDPVIVPGMVLIALGMVFIQRH